MQDTGCRIQVAGYRLQGQVAYHSCHTATCNLQPVTCNLPLLILPPFVYPLRLNLLQVFFRGAFFVSGEVGDFQYPRQQVGEADAVDSALVELIAEAIVEGHGDVFVVGPAEGEIIKVFETQGGGILVWLFSSFVAGGIHYKTTRLQDHLVFVSNDLLLIGNFDFNHRIFINDDGLAAKAAFDAGVDGPINEVFFFVTNFFQRIFAFVDVDVAGAAGTNLAAVVVEVNFVLLGHFQDTNIRRNILDRFGCDVLILEGEFDGGHVVV